ncbi:MAG: hypothetical protein MUO76_21825 [Anaerolineaceae bacterium]|nr:hypothetical protein [Anaerolineaceae bacterium]
MRSSCTNAMNQRLLPHPSMSSSQPVHELLPNIYETNITQPAGQSTWVEIFSTPMSRGTARFTQSDSDVQVRSCRATTIQM